MRRGIRNYSSICNNVAYFPFKTKLLHNWYYIVQSADLDTYTYLQHSQPQKLLRCLLFDFSCSKTFKKGLVYQNYHKEQLKTTTSAIEHGCYYYCCIHLMDSIPGQAGEADTKMSNYSVWYPSYHPTNNIKGTAAKVTTVNGYVLMFFNRTWLHQSRKHLSLQNAK